MNIQYFFPSEFNFSENDREAHSLIFEQFHLQLCDASLWGLRNNSEAQPYPVEAPWRRSRPSSMGKFAGAEYHDGHSLPSQYCDWVVVVASSKNKY